MPAQRINKNPAPEQQGDKKQEGAKRVNPDTEKTILDLIKKALEAIGNFFTRLFGGTPSQQHRQSTATGGTKQPQNQGKRNPQQHNFERANNLLANWAKVRLEESPDDKMGKEMLEKSSEFKSSGYSPEAFEELKSYMAEKSAEDDLNKGWGEKESTEVTLEAVLDSKKSVDDLAEQVAKNEGMEQNQGQSMPAQPGPTLSL